MAFLGTSKALEGLPVEAVPLTLEEDTAVVAIDLAGYTTTLVDSFFVQGIPTRLEILPSSFLPTGMAL